MELSFGNIKPNDNDDREWSKFIAIMFMDGVDKKLYGSLMKDLETDYSLGKKDVYPDEIESALQVLIMFSEKKLKRKVKKANIPETNFVQTYGKCWECGQEGHLKKDCPERHAKKMAQKHLEQQEQFNVANMALKPVWIPSGWLECYCIGGITA